MEMLAEYYSWIKAIHVIAVISWMAGMLYLPRLFAYHVNTKIGSELDQTFQIMERRLLRIIMNPAMIVTLISGLAMVIVYGLYNLTGWFHVKVTMVSLLFVMHGLMSKWRKEFTIGENIRSEKFYKFFNEVPTLAMIIIIIMVVVKPF
jgi:putative membrane protein